MKIILIRQTEIPQPLQSSQMHEHAVEVRAHRCNAEVAERATCTGLARSDFTQPTKYSLLLHDRPNFLFLTMEQAI